MGSGGRGRDPEIFVFSDTEVRRARLGRRAVAQDLGALGGTAGERREPADERQERKEAQSAHGGDSTRGAGRGSATTSGVVDVIAAHRTVGRELPRLHVAEAELLQQVYRAHVLGVGDG